MFDTAMSLRPLNLGMLRIRHKQSKKPRQMAFVLFYFLFYSAEESLKSRKRCIRAVRLPGY
jgi:hypothetical protein